jgi:hypothetical protein
MGLLISGSQVRSLSHPPFLRVSAPLRNIRFTAFASVYSSLHFRSSADRLDHVAAGQIILPNDGLALRFRVP